MCPKFEFSWAVSEFELLPYKYLCLFLFILSQLSLTSRLQSGKQFVFLSSNLTPIVLESVIFYIDFIFFLKISLEKKNSPYLNNFTIQNKKKIYIGNSMANDHYFVYSSSLSTTYLNGCSMLHVSIHIGILQWNPCQRKTKQ